MTDIVEGSAPVRTGAGTAASRLPEWVGFAVLALAVVLERLPTIGFAYLNVDESAYLLIGAAMRHGAIPYIDIVDRKPVGLYLIYAAADALFPDAIIGARVLGLLATLASAVMIGAVARRFMGLSRELATLAGVLFSLYAILYGGDAAQYNVFVMPFVVAGALLVLEALRAMSAGRPPAAARIGLAGLLIGLAMQVKYTPAFEGMVFAAILMVFGYVHRAALGAAGRRALVLGLGLMLIGGLLPTAIAAGVYWHLKALDAFIFYNFTVNLVRTATDYPIGLLWFRIAEVFMVAAPLVALSLRYVAQINRTAGAAARPAPWVQAAIAGWLFAALVGAVVQRQPYLHYFYALVPPLALCAAGSFRDAAVAQGPWPRRLAAFVLLLPIAGYFVGWRVEIATHGSAYLPRVIAADLRAARVRSLYVFNSFGIIYYLSGLPAPTRYTLPTHLLRDLEAASFRFDALGEVRRILGSHPEVIAVTRPFAGNIAADRVALLDAALQDGYCLWRTYDAGHDTIYLYRSDGILGREPQRACAAVPAPKGAEGAQ